jgi:hypothetical protein
MLTYELDKDHEAGVTDALGGGGHGAREITELICRHRQKTAEIDAELTAVREDYEEDLTAAKNAIDEKTTVLQEHDPSRETRTRQPCSIRCPYWEGSSSKVAQPLGFHIARHARGSRFAPDEDAA